MRLQTEFSVVQVIFVDSLPRTRILGEIDAVFSFHFLHFRFFMKTQPNTDFSVVQVIFLNSSLFLALGFWERFD